MINKLNLKIGKFASFLGLNSFLALIINILIAKTYGTSKAIEIYFAALILIYNLDRFFAVGSLSEIFTSKYIKIRDNFSQNEAMYFFSTVVYVFFILSIFVSLILFFLSNQLIDLVIYNFSNKEILEISFYFKLLLLLLPFKIFNALSTIPFRSNEKYNTHEKVGIFLKIFAICSLILLPLKYGITILIFIIFFNVFIKFFLIIYLFKKNNYYFIFKIRKNPYLNYTNGKTILACFSESIAYNFSQMLILSSLSGMSQGILAIYYYVGQIMSNVYPIISNSITTIFLTEISKISKNKIEIAKNFLQKICFVSFILIIFIINCSEYFLTIIWGSNNFSEDSIKIAYYLLVFHFSTIFFSLTDAFFQKFNISKNLHIPQLIGKNIILIISSIAIWMFFEYDFLVLIIVGVAKTIILFLFSALLNYFNNNDFVFYKGSEIVRYIALTISSIAIYFFINYNFFILKNIYFNFLISVFFTFLIICLLNFFIKAYDIKELIKL